MKTLLTVTAIIEGITGLTLLLAPTLVISMLLASSLVEPTGVILGRLTGVALISLTIMCWMYRNESDHARGVLKALLFYNVAAAALLVYAGTVGFSVPPQWAVALMHLGMAGWCIKVLQEKKRS